MPVRLKRGSELGPLS